MVTRKPSPLSSGFSDAVIVAIPGGKWIHVAGQLGLAENKKPPQGDFEREVNLCFGHVAKVLAGCGARLADVVKITTYLTDLNDYAAFGKARAIAFGTAPPASAAVKVAGLLMDCKVEIEAVAFLAD